MEHGGRLPLDLQGDPVQYYYAIRDGEISQSASPIKGSCNDRQTNGQIAHGNSTPTLRTSKIVENEDDSSKNEKEERNTSSMSNSGALNSSESMDTSNITSMETQKNGDTNKLEDSYPSDTQFQCARLNLFPEKSTEQPRRCAKNFSRQRSAKRYANDFNDINQKSEQSAQEVASHAVSFSYSADYAKNNTICDSKHGDVFLVSTCTKADHAAVSCDTPPKILAVHDDSQNDSIEIVLESETGTGLGPLANSHIKSSNSLTVINSSDLRENISMESLNDYFDSFQDIETRDEIDSGSISRRCSSCDQLSLPQMDHPIRECSPVNSSASSSSYFSFSSSPGASLTFSSSSQSNEKIDEKT